LREQGLGNEGAAYWLTSGHGRHLMDDVSDNMKNFKKRVDDYTKNAFVNVTVWSHPDHIGSLDSTLKLNEKIKNAFTKSKATF
jgi:hypothetical protein